MSKISKKKKGGKDHRDFKPNVGDSGRMPTPATGKKPMNNEKKYSKKKLGGGGGGGKVTKNIWIFTEESTKNMKLQQKHNFENKNPAAKHQDRKMREAATKAHGQRQGN